MCVRVGVGGDCITIEQNRMWARLVASFLGSQCQGGGGGGRVRGVPTPLSHNPSSRCRAINQSDGTCVDVVGHLCL